MITRFSKIISFLVSLVLFIVIADKIGLTQQQKGTPNQIRVLTDANGYLLVAGSSQTSPISQPQVFSNTRLKTDASGNLLVVFTGGTVTSPILLPDGSAAAPSLTFASDPGTGMFRIGASMFAFSGGGSTQLGIGANTYNGIQVPAASQISWSSTSGVNTAGDVILVRDGAANILALKNGTNAQLFRSYTPGLAAVSAEKGITILNNTASTAGVPVQMSGRVQLIGHAWNSTSVADETNSFFIEHLPATVAGTITGTLNFGYKDNAGTVTYPVSLSSVGTMTTLGGVVSGGNVYVPAGNTYNFLTRTILGTSADGQLNITNNAENAGIGLDVTTDGTIKIRTRAQTGYGTVDALNFTASGTAGLAGPVTCTTVTSITVKGGVITAIAGAGC